MTIETLEPAGLAPIPGAAHVTIATGSRIVHISGQTGVDEGAPSPAPPTPSRRPGHCATCAWPSMPA